MFDKNKRRDGSARYFVSWHSQKVCWFNYVPRTIYNGDYILFQNISLSGIFILLWMMLGILMIHLR